MRSLGPLAARARRHREAGLWGGSARGPAVRQAVRRFPAYLRARRWLALRCDLTTASSTHTAIAFSSGEAEYCSMVNCVFVGLALVLVLREF